MAGAAADKLGSAAKSVSQKFSRKKKQDKEIAPADEEEGASKPGKIARLKAFKSGVWGTVLAQITSEVIELVSQYASFAQPTARYITEPIIHGVLLGSSAIITPYLILKNKQNERAFFNGVLNVAYTVLALRGLAMRGHLAPKGTRRTRRTQKWTAAAAFLARLGDNGVVWNVLSFWRATN